MISLTLIFKRFYSVMRHGWTKPEFRGLAVILGGWLALGTVIYTVYEDWTWNESLYFCVMTLTTVGYGDFSPTSPTMQMYTVFYAVLGIGFFVAFNTALVKVAIDLRVTQKGGASDD